MDRKKRFTTDEATSLLSRAGKADVAEGEKDLSLADVLDLAREVGIDPLSVKRELLRAEHAIGRPIQEGVVSPEARKIRVHEDPEYVIVSSEAPGWTRSIVARLGLWVCSLGFVSYFAVHARFTAVSGLATVPFFAWIAWAAARLIGRAKERVSVIISQEVFSVRAMGPWSRREMSGKAKSLEIEEPRMARDPEGGVEVFPLYFLRLRTNAEQIDVMLGHQKLDLRRACDVLKSWRSRVAQALPSEPRER